MSNMSSVSFNNNSESNTGNRPTPSTGESLNTLTLQSLKNVGRSGGGLQKPQDQSETGSSNGGNNSDNSALVSLGNTSFGFNFDSEESNSKEGPNDSNEDSDGNVRSSGNQRAPKSAGTTNPATTKKRSSNSRTDTLVTASSMSSSIISSTHHGSSNGEINEQVQAAADAVASLESIVRSYPKLQSDSTEVVFTEADNAEAQRQALDRKRKAEQQFDANKDADSGGYNTDDDEEEAQSEFRGTSRNEKSGTGGGSTKPSSNKRKYKAKENENKREERNQREKERSFRISKQITELRDLLSSGGVVVPKGTKSSVLTEAATYIRMLQQHQYRSEIDRHQLVQQLQLIGGGAHGPQAAAAVRHFAAQNGVWTLGNFGGVPPKSALTCVEPSSTTSMDPPTCTSTDPLQQTKLDPSEYRFIFNSCGAGIAIASMGGAFIDCNQLFCQLSNCTKQEVCGLTLFNLTARQDLQKAFDQISKLISPPMEVDRVENQPPKPIILRGAMKHRDDLGMSVALVKGDDGIAKCFCVTLVKNPTSPFDTSRPVPASFDAVKPAVSAGRKDGDDLQIAPAFTSG